MLLVCAGLVTADEESVIIRLVYYTTQEYLERWQEKWFQEIEATITSICITYVSFDVFESGCCKMPWELKKRFLLNPFFNYAAKNWGYHVRKISSVSHELSQIVIQLLGSEPKTEAASQRLLEDDPLS
jgi:hypothetical protein